MHSPAVCQQILTDPSAALTFNPTAALPRTLVLLEVSSCYKEAHPIWASWDHLCIASVSAAQGGRGYNVAAVTSV